ncbi:MAG: PD40 domain-containing protein [Candidatus Schekmanbacteria bacterium]|nr:PD40 domain-containing protein [Candidatus Schekmanbacteria bacterium]
MKHASALRAPEGARGARLRAWSGSLVGAVALLGMALGVPSAGALIAGDSTILPSRAGKVHVQWRDFKWEYVELGLRDPEPGSEEAEKGEKIGGVRLYYYRQEQDLARRAIPVIESDMAYLEEQFHYKTRRTIPYVLYSSHEEFEQTNLFDISESILGVTSPTDLKMSMAYWGEHKRFAMVSRHEMAHQFTVQKVYDIAEDYETEKTPLLEIPLWFIEGIAEFYAKNKEIDPETAAFARDMLYYPDKDRYYKVPRFFDDSIQSYPHTYKMGQLRLVYLAQVYGADVPQRVLDMSYTLQPRRKKTDNDTVNSFRSLLKTVTGKPARQLDKDFRAWLKKQFPPPIPEPAPNAADTPATPVAGAVAAGTAGAPPESPGGKAPQAGATEPSPPEPQTAEEKIVAAASSDSDKEKSDKKGDGESSADANADEDEEDDDEDVEEEEDEKDEKLPKYPRRPGLPEPFHFAAVGDTIDRCLPDTAYDRVFLLCRKIDADSGNVSLVLYDEQKPEISREVIRDGTHHVESLHFMERRVMAIQNGRIAFAGRRRGRDIIYAQPYRVKDDDIALGRRRAYTLPHIVEVGEPAFSPDGKLLALVGLDDTGVEDLYVLELDQRKPPVRITATPYSMQSVDWGSDGILISSDETSTGAYNLFLLKIDPSTLDSEFQPLASLTADTRSSRLTQTDSDQSEAVFSPDGRILFESTASGAHDIYALEEWQSSAPVSRRLTNGFTGFQQPAPSGDSLYATGLLGGRYRLFRLDKKDLFAEPAAAPTAADGQRKWLTLAELPGKPRSYQAMRGKNWQLDVAQAMISTAEQGGSVIAFSDMLRDHSVVFQFSLYGDLELGDFFGLYLNRKNRLGWGVAAVHTVQVQVDRTFDLSESRGYTNYYRQREFGLVGQLVYPFETFAYLEVGASTLGIDRFDFSDYTGALESQWNKENEKIEPELELYTQLGFDTISFHPLTGPISGTSLLLKVSGAYLPDRSEVWGAARVEAINYLRIYRSINLMSRLALGSVSDSRFARQYWVVPMDNLRSYGYSDNNLVDNNFAVWNEELQIPLDAFLKNEFLRRLEGIFGWDCGSVFTNRSTTSFKEHRSAAGVLGVNLLLTPFVVRLHYAKFIDIGGADAYQPLDRGWNSNFSIRYNF